ncbi:hypothetical protein CAPTEDRAFT_227171 [Capitella teleta]|uniref:MHD domain-containing protein n=1 Tax=Capitella teleta TaxID=283909 RepID=R7UMR1_CAPTE|nr:hypothetical protein CAPTEDRAFT_227171 [Capitella teleta]|eukprot:ELU05217.1 hypothetical protein CAPTEDRAFT_227171 [Capitella teleta]
MLLGYSVSQSRSCEVKAKVTKGDKNNGFDVLYHNMKYGQDSSREFADFLRESCTVEETYAKLLTKIAKFAGNCGTKGSFGPFWLVLRTLAEKLSNLHQQLVLTWQDLVKDVVKYTEEQHKKHKLVKDQEASTLDTVQNIQQTIAALQKAKETYHNRCFEYEKLKRDNGTLKDLEKAEAKYKKANDDYRSLVDKYSNVRNEFEDKMTDSCRRFQELEEKHLAQMRDFMGVYFKSWLHQHVLLGQVHDEVSNSHDNLTVETLMQTLVQSKKTGKGKPGPIEFIEADLSSLSIAPSSGTPDTDKKDFPVIDKPKKGGGGFLNKRRKEKKKKRTEKDKEDSSSLDSVPKVDEEGFSIRPENPNHNDNSYDSSSDSDSEGEDKKQKILVQIKPYSPSEAILPDSDAILKSLQGMRLSPGTTRRPVPSSDSQMKKSISMSDSLSASKPTASQDLLGLGDIFSHPSSSASTPTGSQCTFPSPLANSSTPTTVSCDVNGSPAMSATISEPTPPQLPLKTRSRTPNSAPLLPGPPPPRTLQRTNRTATATARPAGRQTPDFSRMERADSVPSLNSMTFSASASFGSSRGPSPLTIGMADAIPLAVAFSETVNAYFKGMDQSKCKLKMTGDMMLSFPAGIVRVLMDNPSPANLCFRIKNTSNLEHILVNKQLITEVPSMSTESRAYHFDMQALTEHLRKQSEQNKSASYFNMDILKYQIRAEPTSVPLQLTSLWKCGPTETEFHLEYSLNSASSTLSNVHVLLPMDREVIEIQGTPSAQWSSDTKRCTWKCGEIPGPSDNHTGNGTFHAKMLVLDGPASPTPAAVQFVCEGSTVSGVDFELTGSGYRLSLVKKRFITGKYISEADNSTKQTL